MSIELIDKKTGELVATCPDVSWAVKHMAFWGLTLKHVELRLVRP